MDLAELSERLVPFCREHLGDDATVSNVETMPGHAGFSFGFTATAKGESRSYVLRVPPPNVRRVGTADVIRQARVVHALRDTDVPVVNVIWSGEDERWFGSPYFVVNKLEGDVLRSDWGWEMPADEMRPVAFRAMRALAALHRLDWQEYVPDDGPPLELEPDVTRWDRFYERSGDKDLVALAPDVRTRLLERLPGTPRSRNLPRGLPVVERVLQPRREAAGGHRLGAVGRGRDAQRPRLGDHVRGRGGVAGGTQARAATPR